MITKIIVIIFHKIKWMLTENSSWLLSLLIQQLVSSNGTAYQNKTHNLIQRNVLYRGFNRSQQPANFVRLLSRLNLICVITVITLPIFSTEFHAKMLEIAFLGS